MKKYKITIKIDTDEKLSKTKIREITSECYYKAQEVCPNFRSISNDWRQGFRVLVDGVQYFLEGKDKTDVKKIAIDIFGKKRKIEIFDDFKINGGKKNGGTEVCNKRRVDKKTRNNR